MEIEFAQKGILVKGKSKLDVLALSDDHCLILEKSPKSHKGKKQLLNDIICSIWLSKKAREKYSIE